MQRDKFNEDVRQQLKDKGYAAVVLQVTAQYGRQPDDIASRHRSVAAAQKRCDANQRVEPL
jgi:hypothetical protein